MLTNTWVYLLTLNKYPHMCLPSEQLIDVVVLMCFCCSTWELLHMKMGHFSSFYLAGTQLSHMFLFNLVNRVREKARQVVCVILCMGSNSSSCTGTPRKHTSMNLNQRQSGRDKTLLFSHFLCQGEFSSLEKGTFMWLANWCDVRSGDCSIKIKDVG